METFLFIVFFVSCLVLVISVLLQPGKTDAGALFTSGVNSSSMNPRGTASVLSKLTIAAATIFMLTALMLSLPALTGNVSVLQTQGDKDSSGAASANSNTANSNATNSNAADSNSADSNSAESNSNADANSETGSSNTKSDDKDDSKTDEKPAADDDKKSDSESDSKPDEKKDDNK